MPAQLPIPDACRLTIMLHSRDHAHHHSLATEILNRARNARLIGATMLQAVEGQGRSRSVHRQHLFSDDVPLSIVIIDEEMKVTAFVEALGELLQTSFVLIEPVTAYRV